MKKFIALVLALIMVFSLGTVAFAEETAAPEVETTAPVEGEEGASELDWLLDLPFWTVGPAFKLAKIALKLVKVFVKVAGIFGIEPGDIITEIENLIANSQQNEEVVTTAAPAATPAIA